MDPLRGIDGEAVQLVLEALDQVIDWEESELQSEPRAAVASGLDPTLDELRGLREQLPGFLDRLADEQLAEHAQLDSLRVEFLPQRACIYFSAMIRTIVRQVEPCRLVTSCLKLRSRVPRGDWRTPRTVRSTDVRVPV